MVNWWTKSNITSWSVISAKLTQYRPVQLCRHLLNEYATRIFLTPAAGAIRTNEMKDNVCQPKKNHIFGSPGAITTKMWTVHWVSIDALALYRPPCVEFQQNMFSSFGDVPQTVTQTDTRIANLIPPQYLGEDKSKMVDTPLHKVERSYTW